MLRYFFLLISVSSLIFTAYAIVQNNLHNSLIFLGFALGAFDFFFNFELYEFQQKVTYKNFFAGSTVHVTFLQYLSFGLGQLGFLFCIVVNLISIRYNQSAKLGFC